MTMHDTNITIYIDGACSGNPGKGGYGIVVLMPAGERFEVSEFMKSTTNNQAELMAAIAALTLLPDAGAEIPITVYSDSNYVVKGITEWIHDWETNDWKTSRGNVKYKTLWLKLQELSQKHKIEWRWTKGHCDDDYNILADTLAKDAIKNEKGSYVQK